MWAKNPITARMFLSISGDRKNNFHMDCTVMKKPSSQTLLDYSILSLAVSPELYGIIIVCTPLSAVGRVEPLTRFSKRGAWQDLNF